MAAALVAVAARGEDDRSLRVDAVALAASATDSNERSCSRLGVTGHSALRVSETLDTDRPARLPIHYPNPRGLPVKAGNSPTGSDARKRSVCRHIHVESPPHVLLAMQKVEGSNPFSRFAEGLHLQVFFWAQPAGASASTGSRWVSGGHLAAGAFQN